MFRQLEIRIARIFLPRSYKGLIALDLIELQEFFFSRDETVGRLSEVRTKPAGRGEDAGLRGEPFAARDY